MTDISMTLKELHAIAMPVKKEPAFFVGVTLDVYQSNAMVGEAGEVANVVKKMARDGESADLDEKMISECGDVLFYMRQLLHRRGFTLDDAGIALVRKLREMQAEMETA